MSDINFAERHALGLKALEDGREIWFDHPKYVGRYQVSNMGNVRRLKHRRWGGRWGGYFWVSAKIMPIGEARGGYLATSLGLVHRLVLETFVGPCPEGMECRHLDGTRTGNWLNNLCWGTRLENHNDMIRHGTKLLGERAPRAKLRSSDIPVIHQRYKAGESCRELSKSYGIHITGIKKILAGISYKDAQTEPPTKLRKGPPKGAKHGRARLITFDGRTMLLREWAALLDINPESLHGRIINWGLEIALTTPRSKSRPKR